MSLGPRDIRSGIGADADLRNKIGASYATAVHMTGGHSQRLDVSIRDLAPAHRPEVAAQRWMKLARGYELGERLTRFINNQPKPSAHEYRLYVHDREGHLVVPRFQFMRATMRLRLRWRPNLSAPWTPNCATASDW